MLIGFSLIVILILFEAIVLHEALHAIVAGLLGYPTKTVYLGWPLTKHQWCLGKIGPTKIVLTPFFLVGAAVDLDYLKGKPSHQEEVSGWRKLFAFEPGFWETPAWHRTLIALAGPAINFIQAYLILVILTGGWQSGWEAIVMVVSVLLESIRALFIGTVPLTEWYSPIGMVAMTAPMMAIDPIRVSLALVVIFNLAFAVINMLPIPALDGGHVTMAWVIELFVCLGGNRERLSRTANGVLVGTFMGLSLLSVFLVAKDIMTLMEKIFGMLT